MTFDPADPSWLLPKRTQVPLESVDDWESLRLSYEVLKRPGNNLKPWRRCLLIARKSGARTAIVEKGVLDHDYRAEFSEFYANILAPIHDTAHRVHFFGEALTEPDLNDPVKLDQSYLGYVTVRPNDLEPVGKTVLAPPPGFAVRAAIKERVHFFGHVLTARGVPFMQQDARLAVCAHAAIWSILYVAWCRREVGLKSIVDIVHAGHGWPLDGSAGLYTDQIAEVFRKLGLRTKCYLMAYDVPDPETVMFESDDRLDEIVHAERNVLAAQASADLGTSSRGGTYPPSEEVRAAIHNALNPMTEWLDATSSTIEDFSQRRLGTALTASLNSAIPVCVCSVDHAFIVCGYRGYKGTGPDGWTEYVIHDDQVGPYLKVARPFRDFQFLRDKQAPDSLSDADCESALHAPTLAHDPTALATQFPNCDMNQKHEWSDIIQPMPWKVHLEFHPARDSAQAAVIRYARELQDVQIPAISLHPDVELLQMLESGFIGFRTYLIRSARFLRELAARGVPDEISAHYRTLSLADHVHVVDLVDERLPAGSDRVFGEVLLDSTSGTFVPRRLVVHAGEHLIAWDPDEPDDPSAYRFPFALYQSGAPGLVDAEWRRRLERHH